MTKPSSRTPIAELVPLCPQCIVGRNPFPLSPSRSSAARRSRDCLVRLETGDDVADRVRRSWSVGPRHSQRA